jgi:uncharacterized cofD-like protein
MTRVVAIGGGHGLATTLLAVRRYADDICAIVATADDGGSSGRLRAAFGIPPPGDMRRCLVALAEPGSPWAEAFEHRFSGGELDGHAFGNLVIAGLADACGSFGLALTEAGRLLRAAGRVVPATEGPVVLKAEVETAAGARRHIEGQVSIANSERIVGVSVVPADPAPSPVALEALARADQVVIGPGSLFTSILAVVAVPALRRALAATSGRRVYVCNLRPQVPETAGFDVASHVDALSSHGLDVDVVVCHPGGLPLGQTRCPTVERPVALPDGSAHDPDRLAGVLADLVG